jgi:hypothetical protein
VATFNPKTKFPSVSFQVKAWVWADGKVKIVGDDPDLPNNGLFITVRPGTDTELNVRQMIDALNPKVSEKQELKRMLARLSSLERQQLILELDARDV